MTRRYEEGGEANLLTAQSTLFCLLLLPGSLSRCALNGGEHSWVERTEMRLLCVRVCPKREAQMLWCWRPIRGSFQVFFTWEKWFFSTCLSPAVMKQQFHSLSSVSALWVKSSNISDYFATLLQALPVQLSCWEVGYHHFFIFFYFCCFICDITHVFMCVRKCHDLLKWVYTMVIGDGGSVGCWKVTALMKALSFWQNVTV